MSRHGAGLLLALLALAPVVACEGCEEVPPENPGSPLLLVSATSRRLAADGVTFVEVTVRAYDQDSNPDNTAVIVTVEDGSLDSEEHTVTDDGLQLTGTPSNGALTFRFTCPALEPGTVVLSATNGADRASATSTFDCVEPVGTVSMTVLTDEQDPCVGLLADGQSFCRQPIKVELVTPNVTVPQADLTLTAAVVSATRTSPREGQDATVTDLALLSPDADGAQLPQGQVAFTTDEEGLASFRVHTRLDDPMTILIRVTGTAANGQALEQTLNVAVGEFESEATLEMTASPEAIGSDLTTQLIITAVDHQGELPDAAAIIAVSVPPESGVVLRAGGVDSVDGTLETSISGGTALVVLDAPVVTELTRVTARVSYRPHPSLPVITGSAEVRIFPDNSIILNVDADPNEIASDQNTFTTLTASVSEFSQGSVAPKPGAQVRFTVNSLSRDRVGFGLRDADESPPLNDPDFKLTTDVTAGSGQDDAGTATVLVSSRNALVRGTADINAEVIENGQVVATSSVTVSLVREPILQSIVFVSAEPESIGVRGGAYASSAIVSFRVFDDLAQPLANVAMTFDLNATADPGASVVSQGTTDASGTVNTTVSAGTQAGPLSVVATAFLNGRQLTTESLPIAVTGGLPSFANSYIQCDPTKQAQLEPASIDCTVVLVDRFTNRAPANLPVQFRAEGGNIEPVTFTGAEGSASGTFQQGTPGGASASLLSAGGDSWSYGAVIPLSAADTIEDDATRWSVEAEAACFDGDSATRCSVLDLCFEAEHAAIDLSDNDIYCPLLVDSLDDVGCWNKLEAGALTRDARHLSDGLLAELGITRQAAQNLLDTAMTAQVYYEGEGATADNVRGIVDAHLDNMFRCGASTACISGVPGGLSFIEGDECLVAPGCMDFNPGTLCPQDGLRTITAIVRGEESFTDLNGNGILDYDDLDANGRHNPGEPLRELGPNIDVPFRSVVVDMPEPFLDKDDNCFADDYIGSLRMTTLNAIRRTDLYNDEDGSGSYGYTVEDPAIPGQTLAEPQLTNGQWDRDKQIFFSDHLLLIQGAPRIEVGIPCSGLELGTAVECPYNNVNYLCEETGDGSGVLAGCYPRVTDPVPVAANTGIALRYRWVDANGNCYSPGFSKFAAAYDDSYYFYLEDAPERSPVSTPLSRAHCGFGEYAIPRREWCDALPFLGTSTQLSFNFTPTCRADEVGQVPRDLLFKLSDTSEVAIEGDDGDVGFAVSFRVDCTTP